MKTLLCLGCILALTGCASFEKTLDDNVPDGKATHVVGTITGKFSATQFEADNFVKTPEKVTADTLHFRHTDVYIPLIEIEFKGYERIRKPQ